MLESAAVRVDSLDISDVGRFSGFAWPDMGKGLERAHQDPLRNVNISFFFKIFFYFFSHEKKIQKLSLG